MSLDFTLEIGSCFCRVSRVQGLGGNVRGEPFLGILWLNRSWDSQGDLGPEERNERESRTLDRY